MDLPKAVMLTIPEPWSQNRDMPRAIQDMYHYYATMMEPWDGPAAILFSDGDVVGACLDRNGLRPIRYYLTDDGTVILASEVGVLDLPRRRSSANPASAPARCSCWTPAPARSGRTRPSSPAMPPPIPTASGWTVRW